MVLVLVAELVVVMLCLMLPLLAADGSSALVVAAAATIVSPLVSAPRAPHSLPPPVPLNTADP